MRTLIDIPDDQIEVLTAIAAARKVSRAQLVREAIASFIQQHRPARESSFGLWRSHPKPDTPQDGLAYQKRLRSEW